MELREAIRTTGAVRTFTDEPVEDGTIAEILDDARFAPSGGNRQGWRVAVVKDQRLRQDLAGLMQRVWDEYSAASLAGRTPFSAAEPTSGEPASGGGVTAEHVPNPLLDQIASIPVVLAVAVDLGRLAMMDGGLDRPPITGGASIYPFCWNVLLAARARGLGGVMTTFLSRAEPAAAPSLRLPPGHALAATIFLGRPVHQPTKLRRNEVSEFTTLDRFDGAPLAKPLP